MMRFIDIGASRGLAIGFIFRPLSTTVETNNILHYFTNKTQPENPVDTILFHLKNKNPAHLTTPPPHFLLTILPSHQDKHTRKRQKTPKRIARRAADKGGRTVPGTTKNLGTRPPTDKRTKVYLA